MTADGKIADYQRNPARFGSVQDKQHLCQQIAEMDGILMGASTLRAYGTSLPLRDRRLIEARQDRQQLPQPVHLICSRSGHLDPYLPFFQQPIPRWLWTTEIGASLWTINPDRGFAQILTPSINTKTPWQDLMEQLGTIGWRKVGILGGGQLVAALLDEDLIDELWLTVCPVILGGQAAPTPVAGQGFLGDRAVKLQLLSVEQVEQEIFLHYRVAREE